MEVFNIFKNSCKRTDAKSASVQKINYINYISVVAIYCCHQPSVRSKQCRFHLLVCDFTLCPTSRERLCIIGNRNAFNRIDRVGCLDSSNPAVLHLIHDSCSFRGLDSAIQYSRFAYQNQISLSISFQNLILQECDLDQLLRLYIKRVGDVKERFHGERTDHIRCFDRAQMRAADACFSANCSCDIPRIFRREEIAMPIWINRSRFLKLISSLLIVNAPFCENYRSCGVLVQLRL